MTEKKDEKRRRVEERIQNERELEDIRSRQDRVLTKMRILEEAARRRARDNGDGQQRSDH